MNNSNHFLIWIIGIFAFLDISISFFAVSESIAIQTFYGLSKIGLIIILLTSIHTTHKGYDFLKGVILLYWIGQAILYVINSFIHKDYVTWLSNFNDFYYLIPIYTVTLIIAIIWKLKR